MSSLENPDLRTRDIRRLVALKAQSIRWDEGGDGTSEWVLASLDSDRELERLLSWLHSKNVPECNRCLITNSAWGKLEMVEWREVLGSPCRYFGKEGFQLYDINLKWVLEYAVQEVARFGKFDGEPNA